MGSGVAEYPLVRKKEDPDHATQKHADHMEALVLAMQRALSASGADGRQIAAIALDTTGSSVVPVGEGLVPLDDYYLWCDHRAWQEAARITGVAHDTDVEAMHWCGGVYSSEWGFAKLLHWLRNNPDKRDRMVTALEHCDMSAATLCGIPDPAPIPRCICSMGQKSMVKLARCGFSKHEFIGEVTPLRAGR